jgi:predicted O-linked N-acetylglucosamine transferase (SPINDLY family)
LKPYAKVPSLKQITKAPSISTIKTWSPMKKSNHNISLEQVKIEVNKAEFSKSNKKFVDFDTIVEMKQEVKPFYTV